MNQVFKLVSVSVLVDHRTAVPSSEVISPTLQPVSNPPDMSRWNPFGEDNFSKLTEEELLDREFDLLRASKCCKLLFVLLLSISCLWYG